MLLILLCVALLSGLSPAEAQDVTPTPTPTDEAPTITTEPPPDTPTEDQGTTEPPPTDAASEESATPEPTATPTVEGTSTTVETASPTATATSTMSIEEPSPTPTPTPGALTASPTPSLTPSPTLEPELTASPSYASQADEIVFVPGTVDVSPELEAALREALAGALDILPEAAYYSVSWIDQRESWYFVSLVGLARVGDDLEWRLIDDASWVGLAIVYEDAAGDLTGAVEGTQAFSDLLEAVPDRLMSDEAKRNIDPLRRNAFAAAGYVFPWEPGSAMYYGSLGVHSNGFASAGYGSWLAVDFLSDGNTGAGHAPNRLLAASPGSISYICNDGTSVAIRAGDFMYTHLLWNSRIQYGYTFSQGSEIGQLKTGSFSDICGYASQGSEWFHVHWGFANTGYLTVESWVLNMASEQWVRGEESQGPGSWFTASATPGPVVYDDHDINDDNIYDSAGDGDGVVECGETIEMHVDLRNQGSGPVLNANMTLSENDPYITFPLVNSSSAYPTISGGGTATNSDDFDFAVAAGTPDGHTITFSLYVTSTSGGPWSDTFTVPVSCADPFSEMLTGNDFEAFAPNYWRGLDLRGGIDGPDCDIAHSGECSSAFLGDGTLRQLRYVGAVNGNAGDTLEFSLWARSVNATPPFFAKLVLYNTADGATQSVRIIPGRGSRPWTYFTTGPFTATSAYDRVRVYLLYGGDSNSKVWYDDISLRIDSTERLRDGEFEIFTPTGWTALNLAAAVDGPDCDTAHSQNCSAVIVGDGSLKQYRYVSAVSGSAGDTLEFSLWSRSQNASAPFFAKLVLYNAADGSTQDVRIVPAQGSQNWMHYMTGIFTAAIDYDRVRVYLLYGDDSGLVWYDDVSLLYR